MRSIIKYFGIFLFTVSSLFSLNSGHMDSSVRVKDENISYPYKSNNIVNPNQPDLYLQDRDGFSSTSAQPKDNVEIHLIGTDINVSSLQLEIIYDERYMHFVNILDIMSIDRNRGDMLDFNSDIAGHLYFSFSSLYNINLNRNLLNFYFKIEDSIPTNVRSYVSVIVKKAIDMDGNNVELHSKGYYVLINKYNVDPEVNRNSIRHVVNSSSNQLRFNQDVTLELISENPYMYSSFSYKIKYDAKVFKFLSAEMENFPQFIYDVNSSSPGLLCIKGSSTQNLPYGKPLLNLKFNTITKDECTSSVKFIFDDLINSGYENLKAVTIEEKFTISNASDSFSKIYLKCTEPDYVKGAKLDIYLETTIPLGAVDITLESGTIFSYIGLDQAIKHDIPNLTIGFNLNSLNEGKLKISLLSSLGIVGKFKICSILLKPHKYDGINHDDIHLTYKNAVSPDFKDIVFEVPDSLIVISHWHVFDWTIVNSPSCENDGYKTGTCFCGLEDSEIIPKLGHDIDTWVILEEPTYFNYGQKRGYCKRCQTDVFEDIPKFLSDADYMACLDFANAFLNDNVCGATDETTADSSLFKKRIKDFNNLNDACKQAFRESKTICGDYSNINLFLCKYDRIIYLHGSDSLNFPNFMDRNIDFIRSDINNSTYYLISEKNITEISIAIICFGASLVTSVFLIFNKKAKRKQNNK